MDKSSSVLLPFILQTLSQKQELCDTYEHLCEEIKYILSTENLNDRYENIEQNIQNALAVGQDLGILVLNNDFIRMPFKYISSSKSLTKGPSKNVKKSSLPHQLTQPRRTHTVRPTVAAGGRQGKSTRRRRSKRSRSRTRRVSSRQRPKSRRR